MRALPFLAIGLLACAGGNKQVAPQEPRIEGSLDAKTIQATVRTRMPKIMGCVTAEGAGRRMEILIDFSVQADGGTTVDRIDGASSATMRDCIGNAFAELRFPTPSDGGVVKVSDYPITLR